MTIPARLALHSRLHTYPLRISVGIILPGCAVLVGWGFNITFLRSIVAGLPAMVPNTALGLILAGFSLALLSHEHPSTLRLTIGLVLAISVSLLGGLTLSQHVFGWDAGIDRILFREQLSAFQTPLPGRPSMLTSVNLLLCGLALLLLNRRGRQAQRVRETLAVTAILISLLALIGHVCNVPSFYGWRSLFPGVGMALHTVLAFTALGLGIICAFPDDGLMELVTSRTASGAMARRLILAPILIPLATGCLNLVGRRFGFYNAEVASWLFAFLNIFVFTVVIWWNARLLRQAEGGLQKLNAELEQRVAARTNELAQAIQARQTSEDRARRVLDAALDAVITIDDAGAVTGWNPEAERIFGWTRQEIIGQFLATTIIPAPYREAHGRGLKHFLATGEGKVLNHRIEISALRRDGSEFPIELAITPIQLGDRFIFSAFVRDISERRKAQEKTAWLASFPEKSPNPVVELEAATGTIAYANPFATRLFPDLQSQGIRHPWLAGVLEAAKPMLDAGLDAVRREIAVEETCYSQTLSYVPEAGRVRIYGIDITARKRAEEALQKSEQSLNQAQTIAHLGNWELDLATGMGFWSAEMFRLYGRDPALGPPTYAQFMQMVHADDREQLARAQEQAKSDQQPFQVRFRVLRPDGTQRWIEGQAAHSFGPNGSQRLVGTALDITVRKQQEEAIQALNTSLERRVNERTAQLESANKELEAFSYSVSHDLRAPLRHIDGFVEALLRDSTSNLSESGRRYLGFAAESAKQMGVLVDDLLAFSRMGRAEMHRARFKMKELVDEVLHGMARDLVGRTIAWKIEPLPAVNADRAMLKQVWINLLSNAVKYSRQRAPAEISIQCLENDRAEWEFSVQDNGAGFDMRYAGKLFGVFQRLHQMEEFEGTGIGLANVQRIILRHGGRVWAKGEVDAGATFYFTLPVQPEEKL